MYRNVTEGKLIFYNDKLSKGTEVYYLEPGLYSSTTEFVEANNTLIQERNNHRITGITIKVSRLTQKIKVFLANEESVLAMSSTDLKHIFGGDVRNDLGILMCGKGSHEPIFAYDFVRIQSLMIYTDIVEYKIVGDTKAHLISCFPFISKLKSSDIITTGQYMNYQTSSIFQFRRLLKNSVHSIHIDLRGTSGEMIPFVSLGILRLVLILEKFPIFIPIKSLCKMVASNTLELSYHKGIGRQKGRGYGALSRLIGRTAIPFLRKYIVPTAKRAGADLLEFAVPDVADVVSGKKKFKTAAKSVGRQTFRKQLEGGRQKRSFRVTNLNRCSRSPGDISTNIANI